MTEFSQIGFARFLFGLMAQERRLTVRTVADDAAIVTVGGQQFTVTVTASRTKVSTDPGEVEPKPAKRSKGFA